MKTNKIFIVLIIGLIIFVELDLLRGEPVVDSYTGENIQYLISPLGRSEYTNLGVVDLKGIKVNLVTLKTKVALFGSTEKIYSYPESLLPYKIEHTVSKLWGKEYITEEYDQKKFTVVIRKFKGKKIVKELVINAKEPIQNVILFLFYLRRHADFKIGWSFTAGVPAAVKPEIASIKLELVSIDQITVPAGKFHAYHFKSMPDEFEVWIDKNTSQVPLKIKIKGIIDYTIVMKKYVQRDNSK